MAQRQRVVGVTVVVSQTMGIGAIQSLTAGSVLTVQMRSRICLRLSKPGAGVIQRLDKIIMAGAMIIMVTMRCWYIESIGKMLCQMRSGPLSSHWNVSQEL